MARPRGMSLKQKWNIFFVALLFIGFLLMLVMILCLGSPELAFGQGAKAAILCAILPDISVLGKYLRRLRPVRGNTWWEVQVCALVIQVRHNTPFMPHASFLNWFWDKEWTR